MAKKVVMLSGIFYPVAIMRYFERALEQRDDVELYTIGPYTGTWIPWDGGMGLPKKYDKPPTIPLNQHMPKGMKAPKGIIEKKVGKPIDIWISADAGFYFTEMPAEVTCLIQTDPHCLDYSHQRHIHDYSFCMQKYYMKPKDIYLPYAVDETMHYPMDIEKEHDIVMIGLQYPNRTELANLLRSEGVKVHYSIGRAFQEYREMYNKSRVGVSWSSKEDLIARVFEIMGMKLPLVTNRVPDLSEHFVEGSHYLGFDNVYEAVEKIQRVLKEPKKYEQMTDQAYEEVINKHTYSHRIQQIFDTIGV